MNTKRKPPAPIQPVEHRRPVQHEPILPDPKRIDRLEAKGGALIRKMIREDQRDRVRAERLHVAELGKPDEGMKHGADLGIGLAIDRGMVDVDKEALVPDDPNEKNGATRRGARAYKHWAPNAMLYGRAPSIKQHQHDAAVKYLTDFLVGEMGANKGPNMSGIHVAPWGRWHYNDNRVDARAAFRAATQAVGQVFSPVLVWCVLQITPSPDIPPTVERWAASVDWRAERAVGFLAGALEALAMHYGFTKEAHPSRGRQG